MAFSRRSFLRVTQSTLAGAALASLGRLPSARAWTQEPARQPDGPIRLDKNENPYGPSPKAQEAVRDCLDLSNRYPTQEYVHLVGSIASLAGVRTERVAIGCGSSELLRAAADAFLAAGRRLIYALPTFDLIARGAERTGAEMVHVPLTKDHAHDLPAMLGEARGSGLIYICNPNNPTGSLTPRRDIEDFLQCLPGTYTVVIDEAYHHFAVGASDYTSFLDRPVDDRRLIVLRTFSKVYGLAGLRVGYAVAAPDTVARLSALRLGFGVSMTSTKAADAALADGDHVRTSVARNTAVRDDFFRQAAARRVPAIPSTTNFGMLRTGRSYDDVIAHFRRNNVWLGWRVPTMEEYVRVSFGTPAEMQEFWRVWDLMPPAKAR